MFERIKKAWKEYLERLAKTNEELYDNGKPICCATGKKIHTDKKKDKEE